MSNQSGHRSRPDGALYSETFNPSPCSITSEALSTEAVRNAQPGGQADGEIHTVAWRYHS